MRFWQWCLAFAALGLPALATPIDDLIANARVADVVIIGEVHDNPRHQQTQAAVARALQPKALVYEMLSPDAAAIVSDLRANGTSTEQIAEALDWPQSGWPPFERYYASALAAPQAALFGAEAPRRDIRAAVSDSAAAVFGRDAARFGLTTPLPATDQTQRQAMQAAAHCGALPETALPGMVEAQRLRDAWLARAVLQAVERPGPGPVLVITGNGHARLDWGLPAVLRAADPSLTIHAHAQVEAAPQAPFDSHTITPAVDRPDPCAAFE